MVASDVMTSPPITVRSDSRLVEAARLTQERNVRRLIVVDERGKISGIVSRSDLLQVFLRSDEDLLEEIVEKIERARAKLKAIKPGCTLPRRRRKNEE